MSCPVAWAADWASYNPDDPTQDTESGTAGQRTARNCQVTIQTIRHRILKVSEGGRPAIAGVASYNPDDPTQDTESW